MEFRYYQDVQKFALKAEPVLGKREDVYGLFLVYCGKLKQTANKIYQQIGYKRIAESVQIGFSMK